MAGPGCKYIQTLTQLPTAQKPETALGVSANADTFASARAVATFLCKRFNRPSNKSKPWISDAESSPELCERKRFRDSNRKSASLHSGTHFTSLGLFFVRAVVSFSQREEVLSEKLETLLRSYKEEFIC